MTLIRKGDVVEAKNVIETGDAQASRVKYSRSVGMYHPTTGCMIFTWWANASQDSRRGISIGNRRRRMYEGFAVVPN